jgi:hypothetical protein
MAHANYEDVLSFMGSEEPLARVREYYNAVIDALMQINIGTGYDTTPVRQLSKYFSPLKVVGR